MKQARFILWFNELGIEDVPLVGGKNASLGEMYCKLTKKGINIPNGFAITSTAYRYFILKSGIKEKIEKELQGLNTHNIGSLIETGSRVRNLILKAKFPRDLELEIKGAYKKLCLEYKQKVDVAVRSSATAEDLPDASFAGQQETYLNIKGEYALLRACKKCFASLFTNRAISYRHDKGFNHFKVYLSIGVQKMVRSDLASSGVMFSIDTESGFDQVVFINGSYGLGENIVKGVVNPDAYYIFKPTLKKGFNAIISKTAGSKKVKMVYTRHPRKPTKNIKVSDKDAKKFVLDDKEILKLAKWACTIEEHYKKPMDMEWAKDGLTKKMFIVQARPETVKSQEDKTFLKEYYLKQKATPFVEGRAVGMRIGQGIANVILNVKNIKNFKKGQVLVTDMTDPDWEPIMKIASAIVTDEGGRTCHSAIVARELGIPCIVGTNNGSRKIKTHDAITVDCSQGENGFVYRGFLKYGIKKTDLKKLPKTKTKVMMNIGEPDQAFEKRFIPNDGVGLAREEFIINSYIKIHPNALINYKNIKDAKIKREIDNITIGFEDKKEFFITKLAWGIARIAAAFYPKDVIVRTSDFKTNEYANLVGGKLYEPKEENPMIGWRGASRYYSKEYAGAFALECQALKRVREEFGLTNVKIMIPFCRTLEEGKRVIAEMEKNGLKRRKNGLEIYVMCEIPSNVILGEEFCKIFDGFSIGTNDLTQLTLGLDRDSTLVSSIYDERNEAVKLMVKKIIEIARKNKRKIGICGQAPSDYPEFAQFLVKCGIDSISLNPDSIIKTTLKIAEMEKKLKR